MKKFIWVLLFIVATTVITGCGNSRKTLTCTKDFSSSMSNGIKLVQDSKIEFNNDKIESLDMIMKFELPSSLSSQFDSFMSTMQKTYENKYGIYDGISVKANKTGDSTFDVIISVNYKNISGSTKTAINANGSESYSVNKADLEKQGYSCK